MTHRPIKIDELVRDNHFYLNEDDDCYYMREYTSGQDFTYSNTNNLINNFKKSLKTKGTAQWTYKNRAINEVANMFKEVFSKKSLRNTTLVPIPSSHSKEDPLYDARMTTVIEKFCDGFDADIRELIYLTETIPASHESKQRLKPDELLEYLRLDKKLFKPTPTKILLFDDIITAGAHFRACKDLLAGQFPGANIKGVFIARRVIEEGE